MAAPTENTDLPRALVSTIIKHKLAALAADGPATEADKAAKVNLNKDALLAFVESAKIFISYLTATANDICHESKRQIINVDDVFTALEDIEFSELVGPLKEAVEAFREESKEKNAKKAERTKKRKQEEAAQAEAQEATAAEGNGSVVASAQPLENGQPIGAADQEQAFAGDLPIEPLPAAAAASDSAPPAAVSTAADELTRSGAVGMSLDGPAPSGATAHHSAAPGPAADASALPSTAGQAAGVPAHAVGNLSAPPERPAGPDHPNVAPQVTEAQLPAAVQQGRAEPMDVS